jgi:hypothetical protein
MEDGMAVDVTLWVIFAATISFIYCGCVFTTGPKKPQKIHDETFERKFDRAA